MIHKDIEVYCPGGFLIKVHLGDRNELQKQECRLCVKISHEDMKLKTCWNALSADYIDQHVRNDNNVERKVFNWYMGSYGQKIYRFIL